MKHVKKIILATLCTLPLSAMAIQNGVAVSYGTGGNVGDPNGTSGFNIAYLMQPDSWIWGNFNLFLNFSYGYWKTNDYPSNQSISTYAVAPVLRWYFLNNTLATPFLQGSVGVAGLSNDYFGNRDLGSKFAFQTQGGVGLAFGAEKKVYASLQMIHYSNAGLASQNSGFTVPLFFTVGMMF